ncbi:MAG: VOC family protein [Bacteroidia bacterium]|nr:VOC family protein [Bacteroidia bacterium]
MPSINVYLTFMGDCEEAFNFYKDVFGGDFTSMGRFGDMPPHEGMPPMSDEHKKLVMHVSLPISEETVLMGSDTTVEFSGGPITKGNNFSISIKPDSKGQADDMFAKLSEGGKVIMPLQDTFWNAYFGNCRDKFGIQWMINLENKPG